MQRYEFSKSSNIRAATFNAETGDVEVEFKKGAPRHYANFTAEQFSDWCSAASPGGWFYANVRKDPKGHPELDPPMTMVAAEETSLGEAPPDGWHDLQPNTLPEPDGSTVVAEARAGGMVAQVLEMPTVSRTDQELVAVDAPRKHYSNALARARASRKRSV